MVGYKINIQKSSSNQFENVIKKIPHSNNKKIQKQKQKNIRCLRMNLIKKGIKLFCSVIKHDLKT